MEYVFTNIKIVLALFLIILLPGLLLIFILREKLADLDIYEKISFGLVSGMAIWIPIAWVSYGFGLNSRTPIYLSIFITACLICLALYKSNNNFQKLNAHNGGGVWSQFNIYILIVVIQSILIGYTSQFQTGNSDALTHIAGLRNLATFETIFNSDHVLGMGKPILNTYGDNPWYLPLAMVSKLADIDVAITYATLTGIIYFLSVLAIYTLFKAISGNVLISKIGSLSFTLVSLIIWIIDNGYTTFNLNSHWIIFPQAIVNYVLFPIMLASFIRYILHRDNVFLGLTILFLFVLTRFHPNWLFWAPIVIIGIVIFWNIINRKFSIKYAAINYSLILWVGLIGFLSALSFFISKNTYRVDPSLIEPLSLWKHSGGNLLKISKDIYLYNPVAYLSSRGYFDILTSFMLWYLYSKGVKNTKEILIVFLGLLMTIFLIIFNPLVTVMIVKILGTPIPLYRVFELMWPALSVISIYSVLAIIQLKGKKYPALRSNVVIVASLLCLVYFGLNTSFIMGVYENRGGYYSTNNSPFAEPFSTLRTLDPGKISVRTTMANPIASFTNLDPITTEKWRYRTLADSQVSEQENASLLAFDKPYDELVSIVSRHKIRYILIEKGDLITIDNFNGYPNFIHFMANAGNDQIWEVNSLVSGRF